MIGYARLKTYFALSNIASRYMLVIIALIISVYLVNLLSYNMYHKTEAGKGAIDKIPLKFNKWKGENIYLDKRVYKILQTKSIIHREYVSSEGDNIFLSIVYYPETKVDFHSPEGCLSGKGVTIKQSEREVILNTKKEMYKFKVNKLVRDQEDQKSVIYYFYKTGNFIGPSYIKLRFKIALNKFLSQEKSGSLIRISIPLTEQSPKNAEAKLKIFLEAILPYIITYL